MTGNRFRLRHFVAFSFRSLELSRNHTHTHSCGVCEFWHVLTTALQLRHPRWVRKPRILGDAALQHCGMAVESRERRLQITCSTNFHNCYRYRVDQTDINSNLVCRGVPMLVLHQRNFTTSTVSCALERCWILQVFGVCSGLHRCACQPPKVQRSVWSRTREALCPMHPYEQLPLEFTCPHFTLTLWLCFTHFIYFTDILLGCCWFANVFQEIPWFVLRSRNVTTACSGSCGTWVKWPSWKIWKRRPASPIIFMAFSWPWWLYDGLMMALWLEMFGRFSDD